MRALCGDGDVLHLGCISINILVAISHQGFISYYYWEKVVEGPRDLSVFFVTTAQESTVTPQYKV